MALLIQWKNWLCELIQKIDLEDWPRKFGRSDDQWLMRSPLWDKL